jgi:hypothetical protein
MYDHLCTSPTSQDMSHIFTLPIYNINSTNYNICRNRNLCNRKIVFEVFPKFLYQYQWNSFRVDPAVEVIFISTTCDIKGSSPEILKSYKCDGIKLNKLT